MTVRVGMRVGCVGGGEKGVRSPRGARSRGRLVRVWVRVRIRVRVKPWPTPVVYSVILLGLNESTLFAVWLVWPSPERHHAAQPA